MIQHMQETYDLSYRITITTTNHISQKKKQTFTVINNIDISQKKTVI